MSISRVGRQFALLTSIVHVLDAILAARVTTLKGLIEACHSVLNRYLDFSTTRPIYKALENNQECDALVLGSLVHPLQKYLIWPGVPEDIASRESASVELYLTDIKAIKCHIYPCDERNNFYRTNVRHDGCNFTSGLHAMFEDVVKNKVRHFSSCESCIRKICLVLNACRKAQKLTPQSTTGGGNPRVESPTFGDTAAEG